MRCSFVRIGSRLLLAIGLLTGHRLEIATAQGTPSAGEGPRFLLAMARGAQPVAVDVSHVPVLRRRVTLALDDVPLSTALQAVRRQAHVDFVYAAEIPGLSRRVSLKAEEITVAAALTELLFDAGVDVLVSGSELRHVTLVPRQGGAVAVGTIIGWVTDAKSQTALAGATVVVQGTSRSATTGSDGHYRIAEVAPGTYTVRARYIGYTPGSLSVSVSADQEATADFALEKSAQRLDEVVTTGTVVPTEVKALPTPISVVTAEDIQRQNLQRVDQVFRGEVPGGIAWDQGPYDNTSVIAVRGASTLAVNSTLKTFIDGVEVADPLYIATIDPNSVDRIEITRGPQASTLYGAGALSGVMQIFTKKGHFGLTRPEVTAKLSAGGISGSEGQSTALQTDNSVSVLGGGEKTSYDLSGSYRHTGAWVPTYYSKSWSASAGGQTTHGPLTLSTFARYSEKTFDDLLDARFQAYTFYSKPFYQTYHQRQQTYGLTASVQANRSWQHTLTLGYDQTYLGFDQTQPRFTTPDDSLLTVAEQHGAKVSLLYHTDLRFRLGPSVAANVTAGINYDWYDYISSFTFGATRTTGSVDGSTFLQRTPWTNTGYFGQLQVSLAERFFLTGGLRAERNPNFGADFGTAWSPRVGASYVLGLGLATVKLRTSYGESIRAPLPGQRDALRSTSYQYLANPDLAPERQRGIDGGGEVYLGQASLSATYYNQRAIDLIQGVLLPTPAGTLRTYQNQNLARVKNQGWEFEGHLPLGPVELSGTYSITRSTVQQLPPGFPPGDYQVGDPILGIPRTSAGATVTYSPLRQTRLTASMTHIGHWTNLDYIALYGFFYGTDAYRGSSRAYWIEYPTVTKFAVGVSQTISKQFTAFARAENVGNTLRYEQFNANVPMPRSVIVGANVQY